MPLSTDVNLPKSLRPTFPDRCVSCGLPGPEGRYRVSTDAIGWWTVLFWLPGRRFAVDVPACAPCCGAMRRQRRARLAVTGLLGLVGVVIAASVLGAPRGPLRWAAMGIALLCLLPAFLWETLSPRPIDLTAYSETVDYEFRDPEYAEEFLWLNQGGGPTTDPNPGHP